MRQTTRRLLQAKLSGQEHPLRIMSRSNNCNTDDGMFCVNPQDDTPIIRGKLTELLGKIIHAPNGFLSLLYLLKYQLLEHWADFLVIALFVWAPTRVMRRYYQYLFQDKYDEEKFLKSKGYNRSHVFSDIGFVLGFLYLIDLSILVLNQMGLELDESFGYWASAVVLIAWGARFASFVKKCYIISITEKNDIAAARTAKIANRAFDIVIWGATALAIMDTMSIKTGFALKSIFGLSGFGTLVFSLGSQKLMSEFLASLAIQMNNMYKTGDVVWIDGTVGVVWKAGWLNTLIRMSDDKVVRWPNTAISGAKVANLTRTEQSQVTQTLYIVYEDWKKLPKLSKDILDNIKENVPEAVLDGRRPARAQWREIKKPYLEFVVDLHFDQRPACNPYFEMRQKVLQCIMESCEANKIRFFSQEITSGKSGWVFADG